MTFRSGSMWCRVRKSQITWWPKIKLRLGRISWGRIFRKILRGIVSPWHYCFCLSSDVSFGRHTVSSEEVAKNVLAKNVNFLGRIFWKFLRRIVSRLSYVTSIKMWLAWVQWFLCGKCGNDRKCWTFIWWVTMRQRISAVSWSKIPESRLTFRGHIVDWHLRFVCRCDVLFRRYEVSSAEVAKKVVQNVIFGVPNLRENPQNVWGHL